MSGLAEGSHVLDVGCGIGGTGRFLASQLGCTVTGITISTKQVELATWLSRTGAAKAKGDDDSTDARAEGEEEQVGADADGFIKCGRGKVRFIELDAERMGDFFSGTAGFDAVWITEALSHFPDKALFFRNAHGVLGAGGKVVLADWFKAEGLGQTEFEGDIKPIEGWSRARPRD